METKSAIFNIETNSITIENDPSPFRFAETPSESGYNS